IPGTLPMRLTTIRSRLFPVRTLTALPIVMFSRLTLFTSVILSPTHSPACSINSWHLLLSKYITRWGTPNLIASVWFGFANQERSVFRPAFCPIVPTDVVNINSHQTQPAWPMVKESWEL
uniref:Uncharacterized protein n=1 Tax=Varanus komodoensis TaxID=61221 RepID=A0A8D2LGU4_VARKO